MEAGGVIRFAGVAAGDQKVVTRAKRAVSRLERLSDEPTLTRVVDVSVQDGDLLVTVAVAEGRALSEVLSSDGPLSPGQTRSLGKALSAGLAAAHRAGAVHGSLSLASVRQCESGWVVCDFGVDYVRRCAVREQRGDQDERTDVYGVGAILYEASSGKPPFEASADALPSGLRAQILRCLQNKPSARYGTMDELAGALASPPKRIVRPLPMTTWKKAAAAALAVVALALFAWWLGRSSDQQFNAQQRDPIDDGPVVAVDGKISIAITLFEVKSRGTPERDWWARGAQLALLTAAREYEELQVLQVPDGRAGLRYARERDVQVVLRGRVVGKKGHETIEVEVLDTKTGTVRFARRAPDSNQGLLVRCNELWAAVAQFLSLSHRDDIGELLSHTNVAYEHHVRGLVALRAGDDAGAMGAFEKAIAADGDFLAARIALIDVYTRLGWKELAAPHVERLGTIKGRGGAWGRLHAQRVGGDATQRSLALEKIVQREPKSPAWRLQLASAYRATSQWARCMEQAQFASRSQEHVKRAASLGVQCGLAAGDPVAALELVRELSEGFDDDAQLHELTGDVLLQLGRYKEARASYRAAKSHGSPNFLSKMALVGIVADGRCGGALGSLSLASKRILNDKRSPTDLELEVLVRVWQFAATVCDDRAAFGKLVVWARQRLGESPLRDELEVAFKLARGGKDSDRAKSLIDRASEAHRPGYVARYRLYLRNARRVGRSEDALTHLPTAAPLDRYGLFGFPLVYEVALTRLDAGDSEGAEQACNELVAGASAYPPAQYCLGRVAEAQKEYSRAVGHYREFLDRWFDGAPENRLVRDARDRLRAVRGARATPPR